MPQIQSDRLDDFVTLVLLGLPRRGLFREACEGALRKHLGPPRAPRSVWPRLARPNGAPHDDDPLAAVGRGLKREALSDDNVYAVAGYVLHLIGLAPEDVVFGALSLAVIRMPNRDGFALDPRSKVRR